jgi:ATP-dependent helicase HrpA
MGTATTLSVIDKNKNYIGGMIMTGVAISSDALTSRTAQLPKIAFELGCGRTGRIGCTQPRRIAATAMARRLASELQVPFGEGVGCKMRFQENTSPATFLKFMTDGILLAESRSDRLLKKYDALIIDEAHERSLNIDFILGLLKLLLAKRKDLKIAISSATLDAGAFSEFFDNAPVIDIEGRTFPIDDLFLPPEDDEELPELVARGVEAYLREGLRGDALVFLPGEREIRDTADMLKGRNYGGVEILQLYGRLSNADQQKVFHPGKLRRIILSTNVAETSLTIPNIRCCIDSGLARVKRYNPRSRIEELQLEMISQASMRQRRGRCGRTGPGLCIHLYGESDQERAMPQTDPEIRRVSLAGVILQMAALKLPRIDKFPFLNPPNPSAVREGLRSLYDLQALERSGEPTSLGYRLAKLPLDPHIGAMLVAAEKRSCLQELLVVSAFLSIRDPRERPMEKEQAAADFHRSLDDKSSDFLGILNIWNYLWEHQAFDSNRLLRNVCKAGFFSFVRIREWRNLVLDLAETMEYEKEIKSFPLPHVEHFHGAILSGIPRNIGNFDKENRFYRSTGGRKFFLFPGSALSRKKPAPEWVMSFAIVETSKVFARINAEIKPELLEEVAPHLCVRNYDQAAYDENSGFVRAREKVICDGLIVHAARRVDYARHNPAEAREIFIREGLLSGELPLGGWVEQFNDAKEELENFEIKVRHPDSLYDPEAAAKHFLSVLPPEIHSLKALKKLCATHPYPFAPRKEEIMQAQYKPFIPENYPDWLYFGNTPFQLHYVFDPGAENDGITMYVPEDQVNMLPDWALDYLVPGYLPELLETLLRGLPREERRKLQISECIEAFLSDRDQGNILKEQPLYEALSEFLSRYAAIDIAPDFFEDIRRPGHLRMRLAVMDDERRILAIHTEMPDRSGMGSQLSVAVPGVRKHISTESTQWPSKEALPEKILLKGDEEKFIFPALKPGTKGVSSQVFLKENEARLRHSCALLQLYKLHHKQQVDYFTRKWRFSDGMKLSWFVADGTKNAASDLTDAAILQSFGCDPWSIRSAESYEKAAEHAREELGRVAYELEKRLAELYKVAAECENLLSRAEMDELDDHYDLLFAPGFLRRPEVWNDYKRYLKGLKLRSERALTAPGKDQEKSRKIDAFLERVSVESRISDMNDDADLHDLWVLSEECRLAVFAPEVALKIKNPLSKMPR